MYFLSLGLKGLSNESKSPFFVLGTFRWTIAESSHKLFHTLGEISKVQTKHGPNQISSQWNVARQNFTKTKSRINEISTEKFSEVNGSGLCHIAMETFTHFPRSMDIIWEKNNYQCTWLHPQCRLLCRYRWRIHGCWYMWHSGGSCAGVLGSGLSIHQFLDVEGKNKNRVVWAKIYIIIINLQYLWIWHCN